MFSCTLEEMVYNHNYSANCLASCVTMCWYTSHSAVWVHHMLAAVISAAPAAHDLPIFSNSWFILWSKHLPDPDRFLDHSWNVFCIQNKMEPRRSYRLNLLSELQKNIWECENKESQTVWVPNSLVCVEFGCDSERLFVFSVVFLCSWFPWSLFPLFTQCFSFVLYGPGCKI